MSPPQRLLTHRDSSAWTVQVWVSFGIAVFLCGVGLAYLPGTELDRAQGSAGDTPLLKYVVWGAFFLAMALDQAGAGGWYTRAQAQQWLYAQNYQPSVLTIGALTRLGARVSAANVAFDDHPNANRIETVTVDSVFAWLTRAGLGVQPVVTMR